MIEVEGIVAEVPKGRRTGTAMLVEVTLSAWRPIGAAEVERGSLRVEIVMDLDEADSWLSTLDRGDGVRVVLEGASIAGETCVRGSRLREASAVDDHGR